MNHFCVSMYRSNAATSVFPNRRSVRFQSYSRDGEAQQAKALLGSSNSEPIEVHIKNVATEGDTSFIQLADTGKLVLVSDSVFMLKPVPREPIEIGWNRRYFFCI